MFQPGLFISNPRAKATSDVLEIKEMKNPCQDFYMRSTSAQDVCFSITAISLKHFQSILNFASLCFASLRS